MHGGIGRSIHSVEQIEKLERPITMDAGSIILMDLLWYASLEFIFTCDLSLLTLICIVKLSPFRSDPTENDSIEGLRPNARGPGLVTFGVCMPLFTCFMSDDFYLLCLVCMIDHRQYVPSHGEYK